MKQSDLTEVLIRFTKASHDGKVNGCKGDIKPFPSMICECYICLYVHRHISTAVKFPYIPCPCRMCISQDEIFFSTIFSNVNIIEMVHFFREIMKCNIEKCNIHQGSFYSPKEGQGSVYYSSPYLLQCIQRFLS